MFWIKGNCNGFKRGVHCVRWVSNTYPPHNLSFEIRLSYLLATYDGLKQIILNTKLYTFEAVFRQNLPNSMILKKISADGMRSKFIS